MPAHSASKTRVNALMLGIPSTAQTNRAPMRSVSARRLYATEEGGEKRLRPGDEIGGKPRPDIVGDHFRRPELGVSQSAHAGEALLLARDVIRHAGEGCPGHHDLAGCDFSQRIGGIETVV